MLITVVIYLIPSFEFILMHSLHANLIIEYLIIKNNCFYHFMNIF
jgi:hypothetical protein